ncbi:MAG: carbohydrate binding domain-containing protein [Opitutaceae bacterium]|nr:carbohydrate binding domain-containing protein [Opitutaceae bacterium]
MTRTSRLSRRSLIALALLGFVSTGDAVRAQSTLKPFVLPWDDGTATATSLAHWQADPAGSHGFVTVDEAGHFAEGPQGERIRFLGVNIGASACFPPKSMADALAARMAKFGINAVRFHHMEAPWEARSVLVDYTTDTSGNPIGNSRNLNADRLDRLHYFISRLKAHGIYTNINLLVSRQFFPDDGLPAAISQLGWKDQHILGFFDATALALHKEYATKVLTSQNPYTSSTLAADPSIAFVEIMNENGLLQKWHEGVLDTLPAVFRDELAVQWNAWLTLKHGTTTALRTAWGTVNEPLGTNRMTNGDFASGTTGWNAEQHSGAAASFTRTNDFTGGGNSLRIAVTTAGSQGWHVQLNQAGHAFTAGQVYTVSFWARTSTESGTPLWAGFTYAGPSDYSTVQTVRSVTLGTDWQEYVTTFVANTTTTNLRLNFNGFGDRVTTVWLANVRFQTGGAVGLPESVSLEAGTIPLPTKAQEGSATPEQRRDWTRFLLELERTYWAAMREHIKTTCGYGGLVFGTIISNSPPNEQARLDVVDSHSYWQHPVFPANSDWDPVNWTQNNVSMVNSPASSTLAGLAVQRVQGKPHMVTEYQHASPNTYASEGPLFAATYGALQDWDGIWMFAYGGNSTNWDRGYVSGYFDHDTHVGKMANMLLAAAIFRRGDVRAARHEDALRFAPDDEVEVATFSGSAWSVANASHRGMPGTLAFTNRISMAVGSGTRGSATAPAAPVGSVHVADTDELRWDTSLASQGVVTVDTARTKAVLGFSAGRTFDLGGFVFAPGTTRQGWLTAGLMSIEGESLTHAGGCRALLVLTGDQENTGQIWKDATKTSVGANWGGPPVLVEVVPLTLTLPVAPARVQAWALDGTGARAAALTVADAGGQARIEVGTAADTVWYEIAISPGAAVAPTIVQDLLGATAAEGAAVTLRAEFDGWPTPAIEWYRDGNKLPQTGPTLALASAATADTGVYHAVATNTAGSVTTRDARLVVGAIDAAELRLVNVSTRAGVLPGDRTLIPGFVIGGTGKKEVILRGVGPELLDRGVPTAVNDTSVVVYRGQAEVAANDDWVAADIGDGFARVYAFSFNPGSKDSALRLQLDPGSYSMHVNGVGGATGTGLAEIYDLDPTATARIVNLSTRGQIDIGTNIMIGGFVVRGPAPKRVLIRGIGPALTRFGVSGVLRDPKLTLVEMAHDGLPNRTIATNDDWWADPATGRIIATEGQAVGAFGLPAGSKDAALLVWLDPNLSYTALLEGVAGDTGVGLIEIYEL